MSLPVVNVHHRQDESISLTYVLMFSGPTPTASGVRVTTTTSSSSHRDPMAVTELHYRDSGFSQAQLEAQLGDGLQYSSITDMCAFLSVFFSRCVLMNTWQSEE